MSNAMIKKICVGVPVCNEERYLERTLRSLIDQDCDDVRFVVSDNHSTDRSFDVMCDLCSGDSRFSIFRQEKNIGGMSNFKFVFEQSACQYFMWVGGHDYLSSSLLSKSADCLDVHADLALVAGKPYAFTGVEDRRFMPDAVYHFSNKRLERYFQSVRQLSNCTIFHSMFRRESLDGFEFRRTRGFDHVFLSRLLWKGGLHYLMDEFYDRRYFESERTVKYSERISGNQEMLTMHDMIVYYLDDLRKLYGGDSRILNFLENDVIKILIDRFSIQSLYLPDDRKYWQGLAGS